MLCNIETYSQNFSGRMSVSGLDRGSTIKEETPLQFFKSFKDNRYKIGFSFNSKDVPKDGIVLFDMKTTVKLNGRTIGSATRGGWPWLPGDLFVPAEAFDFIPILQRQSRKLRGRAPSRLAPANYEIILEMKPAAGQDVSGSVSPATISFKVQ